MKILARFGVLLLAATLALPSLAADKNYTRGSIWTVTMIKTEPGKQDDYIDSLKAEYVSVYEEAIKQKVITSFKILTGDYSNPGDWDVLILTEAPNFAAIDTMEAKFDAIAAKIYGSEVKAEDNDKKSMSDRAPIRKVYGGKLMQEIHYVK